MPESGTELVRVEPAAGLPAAAMLSLRDAVLSGRKATTARAYAGDFEDFARFMGQPSAASALETFVAFPGPIAHAAAIGYRAHLLDRKLSSATVARRLAALRSAVALARQLGRCNWSLEVEAPRVESYRDTRGPGADGWREVRATAEAGATTPKGIRDLALIRLMHDLALRRAEAVGIDLGDIDLEASTVEVLGKGRREKARLTLPPATRAALADWLRVRGDGPGPVFVRLDRARGRGVAQRLSGDGAAGVVGQLGARAKLSRRLRPHGLRHQAITAALDKTGGDVRAVRKFSRHSKLDTLIVYDDARTDLAGDVARLVAGD